MRKKSGQFLVYMKTSSYLCLTFVGKRNLDKVKLTRFLQVHLMKKSYIKPEIKTVEIPGRDILNVAVSGTDTYSVKDLNTEAVSGETPNDDNTLTGEDLL